MGSKRKPGAYPEWLFREADAWTLELKQGIKHCLWTCSGCGAPYWYRQAGVKHGGPAWRIKDHPEWSPFEGPCWRSTEYGVKCVTPRGARVLTHEGFDAPGEELIKELAANARRVRARLRKEAA